MSVGSCDNMLVQCVSYSVLINQYIHRVSEKKHPLILLAIS